MNEWTGGLLFDETRRTFRQSRLHREVSEDTLRKTAKAVDNNLDIFQWQIAEESRF